MICSYSDDLLQETVFVTGYGIVYDQYPTTEANGDPLKYTTPLESTSCMTNNQGPIEHHFQQCDPTEVSRVANLHIVQSLWIFIILENT